MNTNKKLIHLMFFIIIILLPNLSFSCRYCVESMFYCTFPFMYYAIFILTIWRIAYAIWQYYRYHPPIIEAIRIVSLRLGIICVLSSLMGNAIFFTYLIGSFIKAIVRMFKEIRKKSENKLNQSKYLIHSIFGIFLIISMVHSYIQSSKMDLLERIRHYVYAGSGFGRQFAQRIAKDKNFDLNRLKELILSGNINDREWAFEIFFERKSFDDLIYFQDIILNLKCL